MDRVETANQARAKQWMKEAKVGEGTYAVVYRGDELSRLRTEETIFIPNATGRAADTGQPIAIKKIKVGEFKDGLDMSAVREVQYLRELSHPNVIKVSGPVRRLSIRISIYLSTFSAPRRFLVES